MLSIRARLYAGFASLVVVSGLLGGTAYYQLETSVGQFERLGIFHEGSRNVARINALSELLKGQATEFRNSLSDDNLRIAETYRQEMVSLAQRQVQIAQVAERRAVYTMVRDRAEALKAPLESLSRIGRTAVEERSRLFATGDSLTRATNELLAQIRAADVEALAGPAAAAESAILLLRVANWRSFATHDPEGPKGFAAQRVKAEAALKRLREADGRGQFARDLAKLEAATATYADAFKASTGALAETGSVFDTAILPQTTEIERTALTARRLIDTATTELAAATDRGASTARMMLLGLIAAALVVGSALAVLIGRSIIGPIAGMTGAMRRLAEGDTAVEIPAQGARDEMGEMAKAVDVFRRNAIARIALEAEQAAQQSARQRRADRVDQLVRGFQGRVAASLEVVTSAATELDATARSMNGVADSTNSQAMASSAAAEETSANVQTVAAAAEEMVSSLAEIERQVRRSHEVAGNAAREAEASNTAMSRLGAAAEQIGNAVTTIAGIAGQTNLLALNATIEAARAGDAGKGFAVVASEVKVLAGQTAKATEEVGAHITAIQAATAEAVAALRQIDQTIGAINEISGTIAATVEQQAAATQEISRNAGQAALGTQDVSANVAQVLASAGETGGAAAQVLSAAAELATQSLNVKREVDDFLRDIQAA
ncbi:methyl-accepting chemotaxis protein [Methylobacterium dankookense]|uniref:Methyl-accepting chemotaxis protein CtpH n=1 Tax=Methylobacterium dankookense TaxID=560405 RepID=A0A564FR89_9HYPH|nr:methyl-accepting chemotaxis protein [Methylobacterium dankookense]GJD56113.1 hypothetical protein IFDJLNFL_2007 [Methylobacterium dankookense]VUF10675.1 Methyl-accepting chemotaxis protein CtpH [Methylobacterium dankookense]